MAKDIAPGKWDTSVGGHVQQGEDITRALRREMEEELLLRDCDTDFLYKYIHRNQRESELVFSFRAIRDDEIHFNHEEISEVRFWDIAEIKDQLDLDIFSNNFKDEFNRYMAFIEKER